MFAADTGQWTLNPIAENFASGPYASYCCADPTCAGLAASSPFISNSCSPINSAPSCYKSYTYYSAGGCVGCFCCSIFDGFANFTCSYSTQYYYYDIWVANWTTYYNVYRYEFEQWVFVRSESVSSGLVPLLM